MTKKYEIDMTTGPLLGKILLFSLPLIFSGILQLLYNAADIIVLGNFEGHQALAAVGSTGSMINLITNLFIGFSVGASVVVGRYLGAKRDNDVHETVHTAILLACISGLFCTAVAIPFTPTLLSWMGSPDDVIDLASLYVRIYFIGAPASMLYNFGAGILRAAGDTQRPLFILGISGALNIGLNLFFVLVVKIGVAGVAIATVSSQVLSCILVLLCLIRQKSSYQLNLKKLKIHKDKLKQILVIGLPSGLQGTVFSLSNVVIQSSVNSFDSNAIAGSSASGNIEGFIWTAMNAISQTAVSFTSQNIGARKLYRLPKIYWQCLGVVLMIGLGMGIPTFFFSEQLIGIYNSDPEVIQFGVTRLHIIALTYFTCGCTDVHTGCLRGMGYSTSAMLISLLGVCGLRLLWIYTVFAQYRDWNVLFYSYPLSWIITLLASAIFYQIALRRCRKKYAEP